MYRIFIILFSINGLISIAYSQQKDDMAKFGFVDLKTDSMGVPFYIDGVFVGKNPLNNPIPVLPGFHLVSYLPPDLTKKYIEENLTDAYKRVYVSPNDTLEVFLFYDHYISETETLDRQHTVRRMTAVSIIVMIVFLLFQIT